MQISKYRDILKKHGHDKNVHISVSVDSAFISTPLPYIFSQIHIITKSSSKLSEVKKKISIFNQILKGSNAQKIPNTR